LAYCTFHINTTHR